MPLTDKQCSAAKPETSLRKLSDSGGLQLWIFPTASKLWRLAYRHNGKQKVLAIARYPDVSLLKAREEREKAKAKLRDGIDPSQERKAARRELAAESVTFDLVADEYLEKLRREKRADATMVKMKWLLDFARPTLGKLPIQTIRPGPVLEVLRKVEKRGKYETADRLRSAIGAVFRYAVATARAEQDPTAALRGAITTPQVTPRPAITTPKEFGALLRAIDGFSGQAITRNGLKLMALLFPRPGELRGAEWTEFDLEERVWLIPARRMKMRLAHYVPLARQAIEVLADQRRMSGEGKFVFPSIRTNRRPMSENTLNAALRRLGYAQDEMTAHGFRASASTLLNESGKWNPDAIERQLAHVETNQIRRAYARGRHWDECAKMMASWADYLDELRLSARLGVEPFRPRLPLQ